MHTSKECSEGRGSYILERITIEDTLLLNLREVEPIRNDRTAGPKLQTLLRYSQQVIETALKKKKEESATQDQLA